MEGGKLLRHKLAGMDDLPSFPSWRNHLYVGRHKNWKINRSTIAGSFKQVFVVTLKLGESMLGSENLSLALTWA
jgi:glucose/arabinose dehydrogenase